MSKHLQRFAHAYIAGKPASYLLALGFICRGVLDKGRLSEKIRDEIVRLGPGILKINVERRTLRYQNFLQKRLELADDAKAFERTVKALRLKDFRGFGSLSEEDKGLLVNFNSQKNIFYAPNGGGKTSLCEALEYIFTGGLKEAERRRTKLSDYIKRGVNKPVARAMLSDDSIFQGVASIDTCFLDRNRLQEFSLLGSKDTNFLERDVLAALFGLEEIEELIGRFVQPRNFSLATCKILKASTELDRQWTSLSLIEENKAKALKEIESHKTSITSTLGLGHYDRDDIASRLAFKKKFLEFKRDKFSNLKQRDLPQFVSVRAITIWVRRYERFIESYHDSVSELMDYVQEVQFEELFQAIENLSDGATAERCPACLTPLTEVATNPFERARKELNKLEYVADAKKRVAISKRSVERIAKDLAIALKTFRDNDSKGIPIPSGLISLINEVEQLIANDTLTLNDKLTAWQGYFAQYLELVDVFSDYANSCANANKELAGSSSEYKQRQSQIEKLDAEMVDVTFHSRSIKRQRLVIQELVPSLLETKKKIVGLGGSKKEEESFNNLVTDIEKQYQFLLADLKEYKLKVEDSQIAGIEEKATEFYQKINEGDEEHEKVGTINFVRLEGGYRVSLQLLNGGQQDAFSCLSEGHLRTLGLSLLLAVASVRKYPFIVFDDVVNAIDAEHRANIIALLFGDPYLSNVQQIITTHDRLFWERYCNAARRKFGEDNLYARVLTCTNKGIVISDYEGGFKRKISHSLKMYDIRQALVYCRIWFETMVARYCTENEVEITAVFNKRQLKPNNYLEISLESTYGIIEPALAWDSTHYHAVKRDLINWKGQNQAHHAFEEGSLNFVHAKTSAEVSNIFEAISKLEYQLFPDEFHGELEKERNQLEGRAKREQDRLANADFIEKAPAHIVASSRELLAELERKIKAVVEDLAYVGKCVAEKDKPA